MGCTGSRRRCAAHDGQRGERQVSALGNQPAGRYLAIAQPPFRIALVIPSLPLLDYLGSTTGSFQIMVAALVLTELGKLWTLRRRPVAQVGNSRMGWSL